MPAFPPRRALVADIGGTRARFALVDRSRGIFAESVLEVAAYPDPLSAIASYLADHGRPDIEEIALAIAGPVDNVQGRLTNGTWHFNRTEMAASLGIAPDRLLFLNDFSALALALPELLPAELRQLGGGDSRPDAPKAVLGPGTGLGVSGLVKSAHGWVPLVGEGGHVTLAPNNDREAEILALARRELPHISAERLVSGHGLPRLHRLVCAVDGLRFDPLEAPDLIAGALAGEAGCRGTIATFCALLGNVAGNLALTLGATGGVYIGGGIVPRLGGLFDDSPFRARFESKGRFESYLAAIPVHVILATSPALRGAAQALRQRQEADQ